MKSQEKRARTIQPERNRQEEMSKISRKSALCCLGLYVVACYALSLQVGAQTLPTDPALQPGIPLSEIPNAGQHVRTDMHRLGWQWSFYEAHIPMAWEITKGSPDFVLSISDPNGHLHDNEYNNGTHPDISESIGNFRSIANSNPNFRARPLPADDHHFSDLILAVAAHNGVGIVGVAPNCIALATNPFNDYALFDVDPQTSGTQIAAVVTNSGSGGYHNAIESGAVVACGAGNHTWEFGAIFGDDIGPYQREWAGANVIIGASPAEDIKILSVGAVADGEFIDLFDLLQQQPELFEGTCPDEGGQGICPNAGGNYFDNTRYRFIDDWNFSAGVDKFSTDSDPFNRRIAKERAFIDVVMPLNQISGRYAEDAQSQQQNDERYGPWYGSTSRASPYIGGLVGLMRTVDAYLGLTGADRFSSALHAKAYDIITFTAEKIADIPSQDFPTTVERYVNGTDRTLNLPPNANWNTTQLSRYFVDRDDLQFEYLVQTGDELKRSWAQRMGFGMVNFFRVVAHSIPVKGDYEYSASANLTSNHVVHGVALMHFGSKVNELRDLSPDEDRNGDGQQSDLVLNVLDWGGADMPGEDHNNQGVTRLDGLNTVLNVPGDRMLCIDGIVQSNSAAADNGISCLAPVGAEAAPGKIAATGYIENVSLSGRLKLDDLRFTSGGATRNELRIVNLDPSLAHESTVSEIYGKVSLDGNASLIIEEGATLRLQPGGEVNLNGSEDLIVHGTLELVYPSIIASNSVRKILVKPEGKLIVKGKPSDDRIWRTEINCLVEIEGEELVPPFRHDAELLLEAGAYVSIDAFDINGLMDVQPGCHLELPNEADNAYSGAGGFYFDGTKEARIKVSGRLARSINFQQVIAPARINLSIPLDFSAVESDAPNIDISYTNFIDVKLFTQHYYVIGSIRESKFRAHRDVVAGKFNTLLEMQHDYTGLMNGIAVPVLMPSLVIDNCEFEDLQGARDYVGNPQGEYPLSGMKISGYQWVQINDCDFKFLRIGVATEENGYAAVTASRFDQCDIGSHDENGTLDICANDFTRVEFGNVFEGTLENKVIDNDYLECNTAVHVLGGDRKALRGNDIENYLAGLHNVNGHLNLVGWPVVSSPGMARAQYGHNEFTAAVPLASLQNVFKDAAWTQNQDIHLQGESAILRIECGRNVLAEETDFHLYYSDISQPGALDGSTNNWRNPPMGQPLRSNNPQVSANPNDQGALLRLGCEPQTTTECPNAGANIFCPEIEDNRSAVDYDPIDPELDNMLSAARLKLMDRFSDDACRYRAGFRAMQIVSWANDMQQNLLNLKQDFSTIAADVTESDIMRLTGLLQEGEIHERLGDNPSARLSYQTALAGFANPLTVDAQWRIVNLDAKDSDPGYGQTYENHVRVYESTILMDLRQASVLFKQNGSDNAPILPDAGAEASASLVVAPNPGRGIVALTFELPQSAAVRLVLSDALGRSIDVVHEGDYSAGRHSVEWNADSYTSGLYFLRLEAGSQSVNTTFSLLR